MSGASEDASRRSVILSLANEIALDFVAAGLPALPKDWKRTLFFESNGWDKDADRNTFEAWHVEPLPFRAMKKYGDPFPNRPKIREYLEKWLTRVLP